MKETVKLGLILLLVASIAAGVLSYTNSLTSPIIEKREKEEALAAYKSIIPDADEFIEFDLERLKKIKENHSKVQGVVEAKKDGNTIGYLFTTIGGGYGGNIFVITGILDDEISAIKILKHKETPNIGTKIENKEFQDRFIGLPTKELIELVATKKNENEVEKISGSTVSSKGVRAAVNAAIECYKEVKNGL